MVERLIEDAKVFKLHGLSELARRTLLFAQGLKSEGFPETLLSVSAWENDEATGEKFYSHDQFSFFPERNLVARKDGVEVRLTLRESKILEVFVENINKIVKEEELVRKVLGANYPYDKYSRDNLKTLIGNLRKKIEPDRKKTKIIISAPRTGYRLKDERRLEKVFPFPDFTYYPERMTLLINENEIRLTPTESKILELLAENPNRVIMHAIFQEEVFNGRDNMDIRIHIARIRNKIGEKKDPNHRNRLQTSCIRSVGGNSYMLVVPDKKEQG